MKALRFRKRVMAGILGAALAQGCIENPEPDSRVGWAKRTAKASGTYRGEVSLDFRLFEEREGIRLFVNNTGSGLLDSADFFLELGEWGDLVWYNYLRPAPYMEYIGNVMSLWPGVEVDLGIIAYPVSGDISDLDFKATILKASEDSGDSGHALRGVYAGTFALLDTAKGWSRGPIQALIDAEGRFGFLEFPQAGARWNLNGFYAEGLIKQGDSAQLWFLRPEFINRDGLTQLSGFISPDGDSIFATFLVGTGGIGRAADGNGNVSWSDSISIRLGPFRNRPRPGDIRAPEAPPEAIPSPL